MKEKIKAADYVIDNSGSLGSENTADQAPQDIIYLELRKLKHEWITSRTRIRNRIPWFHALSFVPEGTSTAEATFTCSPHLPPAGRCHLPTAATVPAERRP